MMSFEKVSMKEPFLYPGESMAARLELVKDRKAHEHIYSVACETARYESLLDQIWQRQQDTLADPVEPADVDLDPSPEQAEEGLETIDEESSVVESQMVRLRDRWRIP